jgi:hypothetical protein
LGGRPPLLPVRLLLLLLLVFALIVIVVKRRLPLVRNTRKTVLVQPLALGDRWGLHRERERE